MYTVYPLNLRFYTTCIVRNHNPQNRNLILSIQKTDFIIQFTSLLVLKTSTKMIYR